MLRPTAAAVAALALAACEPASQPPPLVPPAPPEQAAETAPLPAAEPETSEISADFPYEKQFVDVLGSQMAYVDAGEGPVVLFLHGNPTSSYLWRNIIPYAADTHRVVAVDLIGMGASDKPDLDYRFATHAEYLDAFVSALDLLDITLVIHDWGSALGMRYARLNPENVRAMAFMEAIVPPALPFASYEAMRPAVADLFRAMRTPGQGEEMVLENNFFVEEILFNISVLREMSEAEKDAYRAPYPTPESRKPTLVWPREIPIGGEPADTTAEIIANGEWLYASEIPKIFFQATPGALNPPEVGAYLAENAPNITVVDVGPGAHFIQEDQPHAIGAALSDWLDGL